MSIIDPHTRAMFGRSAIHIPLHGIIQDSGDDVCLLVAACRLPSPHPLRFGSKTCHQLFFGDAVFRPRGVWESDKFKGYGVAGLIRGSCFSDPGEWDRLIIRDGMPVT